MTYKCCPAVKLLFMNEKNIFFIVILHLIVCIAYNAYINNNLFGSYGFNSWNAFFAVNIIFLFLLSTK